MRSKSLAFVLLLVAVLVLSVACTAAESIVLRNGILIDGKGERPIENAIVVIEGNTITACGEEGTVQVPADAQVIDVAGSTILPGFINAHIHGGYSADRLEAWAQDGVTTVRDLSTRMADPFTTRDELMANNSHARLVAAGPMLTIPNGYGARPVTSVEDARRVTEELINSGADLIKIGIEHDLQGRRWLLIQQDRLNEIVKTAHEKGIRVSSHISRYRHLEMALEAGVDDVAHMIVDYLSDEQIQRMVKQGMYWVPTLELWEGVSKVHHLSWNMEASKHLRRFVEGGGKVALGTDYGGYIFEFELGMPMTEIRLMSKAGMKPMDIIQAATMNAAYVCGLEDEIGTIELGKIADILVVAGNPLADLEGLRDVKLVIHNGEIIRNEI